MVREWEVDWDLQEEVRGINIDFQGPPEFESLNEPEESKASPWITLVSGAGVGLKGAYVELIDATEVTGTWVLVQYLEGAGIFQSVISEFDLAIGEIGSEVIIVPDMVFYQTTPGVGIAAQQDFSFPFLIPAGSRLSARASDDKGDARNSIILVHVHG
jgi:hypothetical protein